MKKVCLLATGLIVLVMMVSSGPLAFAADKIGIVNVREVMMRSDAGKASEDDFKKSVEEKKAVVQKKETELRKMKDNIEKQRSVLTPQAQQEKEMAYQVEFREYERLIKDTQEELQMKDQFLTSKLVPEVVKVIRAIGEREKYTVIFEAFQPGIYYGAKGNDITEKVIAEFNKAYKKK
jgi:outer membrane protein